MPVITNLLFMIQIIQCSNSLLNCELLGEIEDYAFYWRLIYIWTQTKSAGELLKRKRKAMSISQYRKVGEDGLGHENEDLKNRITELETQNSILIKENEIVTRDLTEAINAYDYVNECYNKAKVLIINAKKNQDILLERDKTMYHNLMLANRKLEKAKESIVKQLESELAYEELRKAKIKVEQLEIQLEQKAKEVDKITKYCDELVNVKIVRSKRN